MRRNPNSAGLWLALPILAMALAFAPTADAAMINIDVLVEDPGDGTFSTIATISSFDNSGEAASDTYDYSNFSFNGDDTITPESDKSQIFFVMNDNGLNLYWVHDSTTDATGGSANTTLDLMDPLGNNPPLDYIFEDEANDGFSGNPGDTLTADNNWNSGGAYTDGYVAGGLNTTLDSGWMLFANFNSDSGLSAWAATSSNGDQVDLSSYLASSGANTSGLRVKFQLSETQPVPEPGTVALFGLGLFALVGLRRRKK